jgi:hypothetical protein
MRKVIVLCAAAALSARGEEAPPTTATSPSTTATATTSTPTPAPEIPDSAAIHARKRPVERLHIVEGQLMTSAETVNASDVVDEMLDELAADVARLGSSRVGTLLLERVQLSDNMNPEYAAILEARLAAAVFRAANVALVICHECFATRSRVENGAWVVSRGITSQNDMRDMAKKYGARTLLNVALSLYDRPNSMAMDVELVRAEDSSIAFAENYRMDAGRAMLYRGADTAQAREARLQQIEDRINQRPRLQQAAELGVMHVDSDQGGLWGGLGRFNLTESFGTENQHAAGLSVGGFINTKELAGGILGAVVQTRVGTPSTDGPEYALVLNPGMIITGNAGNALLLLGGIRMLAGVRIGVHVNAGYLASFQVNNKGAIYGGLLAELGVSFVWR